MSTITVLFGTESGNAQELATRTGKALEKAGFTARVVDMLDFDDKKLPSWKVDCMPLEDFLKLADVQVKDIIL